MAEMKLTTENKRRLIEEAVLSVQSADVAPYKGHTIPGGRKKCRDLSARQKRNAAASYGGIFREEDIVIMCDLTVMGSGKKSILFSMDGFFYTDINDLRKKNPLSLPICYADIDEVAADKTNVELRFKDGRRETFFGSIYTGFLKLALERIVAGLRKEEKPAKDQQENSKREKEDVDVSWDDLMEELFGTDSFESGSSKPGESVQEQEKPEPCLAYMDDDDLSGLEDDLMQAGMEEPELKLGCLEWKNRTPYFRDLETLLEYRLPAEEVSKKKLNARQRYFAHAMIYPGNTKREASLVSVRDERYLDRYTFSYEGDWCCYLQDENYFTQLPLHKKLFPVMYAEGTPVRLTLNRCGIEPPVEITRDK